MLTSGFKIGFIRNSFSTISSRGFAKAVATAANPNHEAPKEEKKFGNPLRHNHKKEKLGLCNIHDALALVKEKSWAKFDETIEISVNLGVDPRKPNQSIRGLAKLPNGTGKRVRVCVFATGSDAQEALDAGAEVVGGDNLLADIQAGKLDFDTVIATPDLMSVVGKVGRILGPRGLMPNPKVGTVTKEIAKAVKVAKAGAVKFRVEKKGIVHAGIGKKSFSDEALLENIRAFMISIVDAKPEGFKSKYLKSVSLSSTMGPGINVEMPSIDPGNGRFMLKQ